MNPTSVIVLVLLSLSQISSASLLRADDSTPSHECEMCGILQSILRYHDQKSPDQLAEIVLDYCHAESSGEGCWDLFSTYAPELFVYRDMDDACSLLQLCARTGEEEWLEYADGFGPLSVQQEEDDLIHWDSEEGKDLLGVLNAMVGPKVPSIIAKAGVDPLNVGDLASGSTDIGIGKASYGVTDVVVEGINSIQTDLDLKGTGSLSLEGTPKFDHLKATVKVYGKVKGAVKRVCIKWVGCHDVPLPPLFGKTVSISGHGDASVKQPKATISLDLAVHSSKLDITNPDSIKEATETAKCTKVDISIDDVSIDIHGFDDKIIGKPLTDLVVNLFKSNIKHAIESGAEDPLKDNINKQLDEFFKK